jgi:hypothetical protein
VQLDFYSARSADQGLFSLCQPVPQGSLSLRDLGFFSAAQLTEQTAQGNYWLSRAQPQLVVQRGGGQTQPLMPFLRGRGPVVDLPEVELGTKTRLRCRLIAWRVPDPVAQRRQQRRLAQQSRRQKRRLRKRQRSGKRLPGGKRKPKPVSAEQLEWCAWVVLLTNVPLDKLSVAEAQVLLRARWQIEVVIKLWKQAGCLERLRGQRRERVECELLAKVLGQLVAHWAVLSCGEVYLLLNVVRAVRKVKKYAERLGQALGQDAAAVALVWQELLGRIRRSGRRRQGRKQPGLGQRLAGLLYPWEAADAA